MNTTVIERESARNKTNGQFGIQEHSAPELALGGGMNIPAAQSMIAASIIHHEAPIGARSASLVVDEHTGHIKFLRYTDENGFNIPTDITDDVNDTLRGASVDSFAQQPGVTQNDVDGEIWFSVDVDELQ